MLHTFPRKAYPLFISRLKVPCCSVWSYEINPFSESRGFATGLTTRKPRRWFRRLLMVTLLSTCSVGAALYMKQSFRDLLTDYYPPAKPVLAQIGQLIGGWYDESKREQSVPSEEFPRPITRKELPIESDDVKEDADSYDVIKAPGLPSFEDVVQMTKERAKAVVVDASLSIEKCLPEARNAVKAASLSLGDLETATRNHIEGLREAISSKDSATAKDKKWSQVSKLAGLKDKAEAKANAAVDHAKEALDRLQVSISQCRDNEESAEHALLPEGISTFGSLQYDLSGSICQVRKLQNELRMLMRYRDLASKTHDALQNELTCFYKHLDDAKGDAEEMLRVVKSNIRNLESLLAEAEDKEKARLNSAFETQRRADEELRAEYVKRELDLERNRHELERHRWLEEARQATDRELRHAWAKHSEELTHMLRLKEEEKEREFVYRIRERLAQEKVAFEAALAGWIQRMRAMEDVIEGRTELDKVAKETQALWIACEALSCSLSSVVSSVPAKVKGHSTVDTTGPLNDFIDLIQEVAATGHHPFVSEMLDQLSPEIINKGVWFERSLKDRFEKVYKVCRRVALVDETGGSLYTYLMSFLQSLLVWDCIPRKYLNNIPWIDSNKLSLILTEDSEMPDGELDTFLLLRSAKAALDSSTLEASNETGDVPSNGIELAVRLLSQLQGQPRLVATDWLEDARRYLEAKQVADSLLAYATARGMTAFQKRL